MPTESAFPTGLDTFASIEANTFEDGDGVEHDVVHQKVHNAVAALQAKVGINGSADATTLDARVAQAESDLGDAATAIGALDAAVAGKADAEHTHAAGDITSGVFAAARLASGTATPGHSVQADSEGNPVWTPPGGGLGAVKPSDLSATNSPATGQMPTKADGTDEFTWSDPGAASGGSPLHYRRDDLTAAAGHFRFTFDKTPYQDAVTIHENGLLVPLSALGGTGVERTLNDPATGGELFAVAYWTEEASPGATILNADGAFGTGGTLVVEGGYRIHTFEESGNFEVTTAGDFEVLLVGGGGGGGGYFAGGGGGGGRVRRLTIPLAVGTHAVVVGAGGAGGTTATTAASIGANGGASSLGGESAIGGGGGGGQFTASKTAPDGGWNGGGGAGRQSQPGDGGSGGFSGGSAAAGNTTATGGGGGGGGSSAVGATGTVSESTGVGGAGVSDEITLAAVVYGSGGGGGVASTSARAGSDGGSGGGNGGGSNGTVATASTPGSANRGGGGGGGGARGGSFSEGSAGGTGVVIIRSPA